MTVEWSRTADGNEEIDGRYQRLKNCIEKGSFKRVYEAFDKQKQKDVAWNVVDLGEVNSAQEKEKLIQETKILQSLQHPNILRIHNSWISKERDKLVFITDIMRDRSLLSYIMNRDITLGRVKEFCRQILRALCYLHHGFGSPPQPIIHRDLKCENIFIDAALNQIVLGNLGLSTLVDHTNSTRGQSVVGTVEFMAPEMYAEKYNEKVDIYAFGMCLLQMVTKQYPYQECSSWHQIYKKVTEKDAPEALKMIVSKTVMEFIVTCCQFDPVQRPNAHQLLCHPFICYEYPNDSLSCSDRLIVGNLLEKNVDVLDNKVEAGEEVSYFSNKFDKQLLNDDHTTKGSPVCANSPDLDQLTNVQESQESQKVGEDKFHQSVSSDVSRSEVHKKAEITKAEKIKETGNFLIVLSVTCEMKSHLDNRPNLAMKSVSFEYNPNVDTAESVAIEMVDDLGLEPKDIMLSSIKEVLSQDNLNDKLCSAPTSMITIPEDVVPSPVITKPIKLSHVPPTNVNTLPAMFGATEKLAGVTRNRRTHSDVVRPSRSMTPNIQIYSPECTPQPDYSMHLRENSGYVSSPYATSPLVSPKHTPANTQFASPFSHMPTSFTQTGTNKRSTHLRVQSGRLSEQHIVDCDANYLTQQETEEEKFRIVSKSRDGDVTGPAPLEEKIDINLPSSSVELSLPIVQEEFLIESETNMTENSAQIEKETNAQPHRTREPEIKTHVKNQSIGLQKDGGTTDKKRKLKRPREDKEELKRKARATKREQIRQKILEEQKKLSDNCFVPQDKPKMRSTASPKEEELLVLSGIVQKRKTENSKLSRDVEVKSSMKVNLTSDENLREVWTSSEQMSETTEPYSPRDAFGIVGSANALGSCTSNKQSATVLLGKDSETRITSRVSLLTANSNAAKTVRTSPQRTNKHGRVPDELDIGDRKIESEFKDRFEHHLGTINTKLAHNRTKVMQEYRQRLDEIDERVELWYNDEKEKATSESVRLAIDKQLRDLKIQFQRMKQESHSFEKYGPLEIDVTPIRDSG